MCHKILKTCVFLMIGVIAAGFASGCGKVSDNYSIQSMYKDRVNFGAKYEPMGNYILHGAGQDANGITISFENYLKALGDKSKTPALSMGYVAPHHAYFDWCQSFKTHLAKFPEKYILPQIAVHFNKDENPETAYYDKIANGSMDDDLTMFLQNLKGLGRPIYVRPGFEFNGEWNGYKDPEIYKSAWIKFYNLIKKNKIENVTLLWDYAPFAQDKEYMKYYPGDQYVDWWALDIFQIQDVKRNNTQAFLNDATSHKKPVMITESTPYGIGTTNEKSWEEWFVPFFEFIKQNPVIKGVCYIDWDWRDYPQWTNWGDGRLESNPGLTKKYLDEISDPIWLHAQEKGKMVQYLSGYVKID